MTLPLSSARTVAAIDGDRLPIATQYLKLAKLAGYWQYEFGTINQAYHPWIHESLDARARNRSPMISGAPLARGAPIVVI